MNISRRGLFGMLAAGVGAAIVRPGILMPIKPQMMIPPATLQRIDDRGWFDIKSLPPQLPQTGDTLTLNGKIYVFTEVYSAEDSSLFVGHFEWMSA